MILFNGVDKKADVKLISTKYSDRMYTFFTRVVVVVVVVVVVKG
jgi:hypothetical protein